MKNFIHEDFLLHSEAARELYHEYAAPLPIFDFHSHLSAKEIAENHCFADLAELWLANDHYKWRAMRWNGQPERFCTGDSTPWEKFLAYARTVPHTLRNPLYHWTHLELKRYFEIDELLNEDTAESIWNQANEQLGRLSARELLRRSNVAVICTTDDPTASLQHHQQINHDSRLTSKAYPTYRPDKALLIDRPTVFCSWLDKLSRASGVSCNNLSNFLAALDERHEFFHKVGSRISDHGLTRCPAEDCTEAEAKGIFARARVGELVAPAEATKYRSYLMLFFARLDAARGWTKQLHLGASRDNNPRAYKLLGPDAGYDSIEDYPHANDLVRYFGKLAQDNCLPQTILYNANPNDNCLFATIAGSFQDESIAGKIQTGPAWWFLDQKEGIEAQLNALSHLGLLSCFVGMATDSRSFLSFSRHEYFRRILCNLIGSEVESGELPRDVRLLGRMVADICFYNAHRYFHLDVPLPAKSNQ